MDRILNLNNALAIATAAFFYKSLTPPNTPLASNEWMVKNWFERTIQIRTTISKGIVCTVSLMVIATSFRLFRKVDSCSASLAPPATPPTMAVIGASITVLAGLLRLWCFAELGRLFDFHFNIKPDHQLVTSGPYSFVRHPSYTGIFASFVGATVYMYSPGQWLRECGSSGSVGMAVGVMWGLNLVVCFYGLGTRMGAEDEGLRRRFGKEWVEFAQMVPCRLIPGIY
ncbi:hypothetical protein BDN71DRAFT_1473927 [Pleurotus eryngii]|uniref:Protein-S-isoprenylcysteine O-methyltransferase n=1 Tax=Pleurotus eryngii TaxID=5323 RepID=A0A9P6DDS1_PLEER|nr:hypothetical protein BDN71DRAFT_1473927 [Pleurotus eryngii]